MRLALALIVARDSPGRVVSCSESGGRERGGEALMDALASVIVREITETRRPSTTCAVRHEDGEGQQGRPSLSYR